MLQYFYFLLGHGKNEVYFCERSKPNCLSWVHIRMIKRPQTRKLFQGWMKNDCSSIVSCFGGICSKSTTNTFLSTFFFAFSGRKEKRENNATATEKKHISFMLFWWNSFFFFFLFALLLRELLQCICRNEGSRMCNGASN